MKYQITAALLLTMSTPVLAIEISDTTPARAITVLKDKDAPRRVLISPNAGTMAECKAGLQEELPSMKDDVIMAFCIPADMGTTDRVVGTVPMFDLTK